MEFIDFVEKSTVGVQERENGFFSDGYIAKSLKRTINDILLQNNTLIYQFCML